MEQALDLSMNSTFWKRKHADMEEEKQKRPITDFAGFQERSAGTDSRNSPLAGSVSENIWQNDLELAENGLSRPSSSISNNSTPRSVDGHHFYFTKSDDSIAFRDAHEYDTTPKEDLDADDRWGSHVPDQSSSVVKSDISEDSLSEDEDSDNERGAEERFRPKAPAQDPKEPRSFSGGYRKDNEMNISAAREDTNSTKPRSIRHDLEEKENDPQTLETRDGETSPVAPPNIHRPDLDESKFPSHRASPEKCKSMEIQDMISSPPKDLGGPLNPLSLTAPFTQQAGGNSEANGTENEASTPPAGETDGNSSRRKTSGESDGCVDTAKKAESQKQKLPTRCRSPPSWHKPQYDPADERSHPEKSSDEDQDHQGKTSSPQSNATPISAREQCELTQQILQALLRRRSASGGGGSEDTAEKSRAGRSAEKHGPVFSNGNSHSNDKPQVSKTADSTAKLVNNNMSDFMERYRAAYFMNRQLSLDSENSPQAHSFAMMNPWLQNGFGGKADPFPYHPVPPLTTSKPFPEFKGERASGHSRTSSSSSEMNGERSADFQNGGPVRDRHSESLMTGSEDSSRFHGHPTSASSNSVPTPVSLSSLHGVSSPEVDMRSEPELDDDVAPVFRVADDGRDASRTVDGVTVTLHNTALWRAFSNIGTEMIINRNGRRMFPFVAVSISGLEPRAMYTAMLEVMPACPRRFKFVNKAWVAVGAADTPIQNPPYVHPDSPSPGSFWLQRRILFSRVKLTNNKESKEGNILLHSMHKYVVQIKLRLLQDSNGRPADRSLTFRFDETAFIAVTAYQNDVITQMKIHNNPFAKAFRDVGYTSPRKGHARRKRSYPGDLTDTKEHSSEKVAADGDTALKERVLPVPVVPVPNPALHQSPFAVNTPFPMAMPFQADASRGGTIPPHALAMWYQLMGLGAGALTPYFYTPGVQNPLAWRPGFPAVPLTRTGDSKDSESPENVAPKDLSISRQ